MDNYKRSQIDYPVEVREKSPVLVRAEYEILRDGSLESVLKNKHETERQIQHLINAFQEHSGGNSLHISGIEIQTAGGITVFIKADLI